MVNVKGQLRKNLVSRVKVYKNCFDNTVFNETIKHDHGRSVKASRRKFCNVNNNYSTFFLYIFSHGKGLWKPAST